MCAELYILKNAFKILYDVIIFTWVLACLMAVSCRDVLQ